MNNKRIICDGCKIDTDSFFMTEYKDGRSYCSACNIKLHVEEHNRENLVKESEFDQMLRAAINTPPLKLKDLKEKLRKEKERNSEGEKDSK